MIRASKKKKANQKKHNRILVLIKKYRWASIAVLLLLCSVLGVTVHHFSTNKSKSSGTQINKTLAGLGSKPGTYIVVNTGSVDKTSIQGLEGCVSQTQTAAGLSCTLSDKNPQITLTAAPSAEVNGKKFVFRSWSGCTQTSGRICTIKLTKGAHLAVKAIYAPVQSSTSIASGSVKLRINQFSSTLGTGQSPFYIQTPNGNKTVGVTMQLTTSNLTQSKCSITDDVVIDDNVFTKETEKYSPLKSQTIQLIDGTHSFHVACPAKNKTITAVLEGIVVDLQPKLCKDFAFSDSNVTVNSLSELQTSIKGTWQGCVSTPWMPSYYVTITFGDTTYKATSSEVLDGVAAQPMYYGGQQTSSNDTYAITDFSASDIGSGNFNIFFNDGSGSIVNEDMQDIKLMGNKLSFDFKHFNTYGPLVYHLYRQ